MATALDYSAGRPSGSAVKSAQHAGVVRYIGTPGRAKNLTKAEYLDMDRSGIGVALVYENHAGDAAGGWSAGVTAAQLARADADVVGFPRDRPIYFAVDSDQVTSANFAAVSSYLDGAASVLGSADHVGVYGEFDVIERNVGSHARFGWQTAAWSGGRRSGKAALFQRIGTAFVGGIACDINDILATDWGQHNAQENDMPLTDADAQLVARHIWYDPIWSGANPDGKTRWQLNASQVLDALNRANQAEAAKVDALIATVAKLSTDPGLSVDTVRQIVTDAVRQNIQITGEVHIGPAA
jgi:hypothetical protein